VGLGQGSADVGVRPPKAAGDRSQRSVVSGVVSFHGVGLNDWLGVGGFKTKRHTEGMLESKLAKLITVH
jgi:hypothetical protein